MKKVEDLKRKESTFQEIQERFPDKFEHMKLGTANKARCIKCNQVFNLIPESGSAIFNIEEHVKACKVSNKRKQSSLESFVNAKKKAKPAL